MMTSLTNQQIDIATTITNPSELYPCVMQTESKRTTSPPPLHLRTIVQCHWTQLPLAYLCLVALSESADHALDRRVGKARRGLRRRSRTKGDIDWQITHFVDTSDNPQPSSTYDFISQPQHRHCTHNITMSKESTKDPKEELVDDDDADDDDEEEEAGDDGGGTSRSIVCVPSESLY
eukprot:scaffold1836_cov204-Alexandrium_tamarense.AAC.14